MRSKISIEELLRWRAARAEAEAPAAPRAASLIAAARPWWEVWPERFQSLVERLGRVEVAYARAMSEAGKPRVAHPVPALVVRGDDESQGFARLLYLSVGGGRLRLRFQLEPARGEKDGAFEATFIASATSIPLFSARASLSVENEYRLEAEIPEKVAADWEKLKVTDRMPFHLILRTQTGE